MSGDDPITPARTTIEVVREVMKAAADDPQVKVAAHELGRTAVTLTRAINTFLLPLAALNYAVQKAREYFERQFSLDLAEVAGKIPPDQIIEPKASIAGPLLQALAFSHEESSLKDMYLALLASAMDRRIAINAHPAFVEIIKQMNAEEARLLRSIVGHGWNTPIVEIRKREQANRLLRLFSFKQSFIVLSTHVQDIVSTATKEPSEIPELPAMVDNWIRLGLVEVSYVFRANDDLYGWVDNRPEMMRAQQAHNPKDLWVVRGLMKRTAFGKAFAIAVGIATADLSATC